MAEPPPTENSIEIPTPWGGHFKAAGWNIIVVMALMALTWFTYTANRERSVEHEQIECMVKLHLYISALPDDKAIVWRDMPSDLYRCLPNFEVKPGR